MTLISGFGQPVYAYKLISQNGNEVNWKTNSVSFLVNTLGSDDFGDGHDGLGSKVSEFEVIKQSFVTWQKIIGNKVTFSDGGFTDQKKTGMDGKNIVVWIEQGWKLLPFQPPESALAVTISSFDFPGGKIVDSDIHFNGEYFDWGVVDDKGESGKIDLVSIATHEIGHFVGLEHSSDDPREVNTGLRQATMFYSSKPGDTSQRDLSQDDIKGATHLYPSNEDAVLEPSIGEIFPDSADNAFSGSPTQFSISGTNFRSNVSFQLIRSNCSNCNDISASTIEVKDSSAKVTFDLKGQPAGVYDLIVHNTPTKLDTLDNAVEVLEGNYGNYGYSFAPVNNGQQIQNYEEYPSYGCGFIDDSRNAETSIRRFSILLFLVLFSLKRLSRRSLLPCVKYSIPKRYRGSEALIRRD